ncbi:MAG: hypothetical protein ACJ74W_20290 [Pyrinomonadaceae bacterium]
MIIYSIKLLHLEQRKEFAAFMLDEVFPTVDKGLSRAGRITGLVLLRGCNTDVNTDEYLWLVYGAINGGARQVDMIEAFGTEVSLLHEFCEVGSWFAENETPNKEMLLG